MPAMRGGQFANQERATRRLAVVVPAVLLMIGVLLYGSFGTVRLALLVMLSVPFALFGGIAALGLRGLQMTEQVRWIQGTLQHLRQDTIKARDAFEKTQKQLMYASNNLGEVGSSLGKIEDRLDHMDEPASLPSAPEQRQIGLETGTLFG